jgi:hypothetical protein
MDDVTSLRLRLLSNGYTPIRNRDKRTFMKAWPTAEITPEEIARWERKFPQDTATGLRLEDGLAVIDIDIDDPIVKDVANAILDAVPTLADQRVPLPVRFGKGHKEAWFVRVDHPFGRLHSRAWLRPGTGPDEGAHRVEVFGGASPRQFGAFGPHTVADDGTVAVRYRWLDRSPADTQQHELPVLTKAQCGLIVDTAERVLKAAGWTPVERTEKGEDHADRVYDLVEALQFDCNTGERLSLLELRKLAGQMDGLRCSASWLEGPSAVNTERCLVSLTHSGHVAIWESASGVTHIEAEAAPPSDRKIDPSVVKANELAEKLSQIKDTGFFTDAEAPHGASPASEEPVEGTVEPPLPPRPSGKRPKPVLPTDRAQPTAAKLLKLWAFCPALRATPVVPIYTDHLEAGLSVTNFRLMHTKNADENVGPRGGRQVINPVDLWMGDERQIVVEGMQLRPDMKRPVFEENGLKWINVYAPPPHEPSDGTAAPGQEFMVQLVPDEAERSYVVRWLAHKVRHPHIPGPGLVMVAHGKYGTGRGVFGRLCGRLLGERYVKDIPYSMITGKTYQSQYTDWAADALLVLVNESSETVEGTSTYQTKKNSYEHLKEMVDPRPGMRTYITRGRAPFQAMSCASYVIATNHSDALPVPEDDRRFAVVMNGEPRPPAYWDALLAWMDVDANVAAFHHFLLTVDLTGYSAFEAPPVFSGKASMVEASKSDLDRAFWEAIDAMPSQVMTVSQIVSAMTKVFEVDDDLSPPDRWRQVVPKLTSLNLHRVGVKDSTNWQIREGAKKYAVYAKSARGARDWTASDRLREEVLKNGGVARASLSSLFSR